MVVGDARSAKTKWSSSHTAVVPLGERFGEPSGADGGDEAEPLLPYHSLHVVVEYSHAYALIERFLALEC